MGLKLIWQTPELDIYSDSVPQEWPEKSFLLSEDELSYCLQSKQESLQRSRAQLRLMVKEIFDDPELKVSQGPLGRPHISNEYDISFSHKNDQAWVGVVKAPLTVGIDTESLQQKISWSVFKDNFFLKTDLASIERLAQEKNWDLEKAHFSLFSLKEAFFKAINAPFTPQLIQFEFIKTFQNEAHFRLATAEPFDPQDFQLFSFISDDKIVSVCLCRLGQKTWDRVDV